MLNRQTFIWNANEFCQNFKEYKTAATFSSAYKTLSSQIQPEVDIDPVPTLEVQPPAKRPRLESTPQTSDVQDMSKWLDTLDYEIEKQKVGK